MAPRKTRVQNTPTCKRKLIQRMKNLVRKVNDSTGPNLFHNILPSPINLNDTTTSQQTNNFSQVDQNCASPFAPISAPEKCMVNTPMVIDTSWYHSSDMDVSSHSLSVETEISSPNDLKVPLIGRRIVDISFFIKQIQVQHNAELSCSFIDMDFQSEIIRGFQSILRFKCRVCGIKTQLYSEKETENVIPINKAVVNACQAIGIGHTQLTEFIAFLDMPSLSCDKYIKIQNTIAELIHESAWEEMKKSGEEEKRIAIECGDIDSDGIPMCTVVADGQWSKRSYGKKYDALSGVASIIGYKTRKVLFVGIRNKYCVVCQKSTTNNNNNSKPDHDCFMNWNKASTSMEADGVVEGFVNSIQMHGLKFNCLIGDGDSSVIKRLNDRMPYGPNFHIRKIECRNHLLRNYATKLTVLAKNTKYPLRIRKYILANILRFRSDVTKAVKHWRKAIDITKLDKIKGIRKDLSNAPFHRLGQHTQCNSYFCNKNKNNENNLNLVPEASHGGIMQEMENCVQRLVNHSDSLLENKDNNVCEQFNSIINKHIAGKRINFSGRKSYSTRVEAAVISFNSKEYIRQVHKKMTNNFSPGRYGQKYLKNYNRIRGNTARRRQLFPNNRNGKKPCSNGPDADYGMAEPLLDVLSRNDLEEKKKKFLDILKKTNMIEIEISTRDQNECQKWFQERKLRLTASNFGQICKMRKTTSCKNTVYSMLYAPAPHAKSLQYGRVTEIVARKKAEEIIGETVQMSGLIIDPEIPYLAASPDGLIGDSSILEIKCPFSAKDTSSAVDAVHNKLLQCCVVVGDSIQLKKNHSYYYQVIGQLHVSRRKTCYFIIYAANWINVEKIMYDPTFWDLKMINYLTTFYLEVLLPEIVDPLYPKRMLKTDIREYKTGD